MCLLCADICLREAEHISCVGFQYYLLEIVDLSVVRFASLDLFRSEPAVFTVINKPLVPVSLQGKRVIRYLLLRECIKVLLCERLW